MIRPAGRAGTADLSAADLFDAVLALLQDSGEGLTKAGILDGLAAGGVDRGVAGAAWDGVQRQLRRHDQVMTEPAGRGYRYAWRREAPPLPRRPLEAFDRLVAGGLRRADREGLVGLVRAALASIDDRPGSDGGREQAEMDAARALAEMAIEVEELAAKQASSKAMIHKVRARMKRLRLEPIDRAGEQVPFDRRRHQPIGPDIGDGTPVVVVRPGYVWHTPTRDVLVERPVVQD